MGKRYLDTLSSSDRKMHPIHSGVVRYFPDALAYVAFVSWVGNEQHSPGKTLRWDRDKSTDEADALVRHQAGAGGLDVDDVLHSGKVAWRALAQLQKELEQMYDLSLPPGAVTKGETNVNDS